MGKNWKENLYQTCLQTDKTKDIYMFARVILYTDEHIEENLKSEEVATQIGMSRSYFSTRFKEITGDTFHNYVISRKRRRLPGRWQKEQKTSPRSHRIWDMTIFIISQRYFQRNTDVRQQNMQED